MACGWWRAVAANRGEVVVVLQYDPRDSLPSHGVKTLRLSQREAEEWAADLRAAITQAQEAQ